MKYDVLVDMLGLFLHALFTCADARNRDRGLMVLFTLFGWFRFIQKLSTDSISAGPPPPQTLDRQTHTIG